MNPIERRELRLPALALFAAILAAGGAVYHTDTLRKDGQQQLAQQNAQLRDARIRLQRSGDEKEAIIRYLGSYQELQRIGFAGEEQRINWLDGLRVAHDRADLFGVDYQITAQMPYPYASELHPGDLVLNQSVMTARLRLLHEEDLLRFFNALRDAGAGMFAVDACAVNRADAESAVQYQPNLVAECKLAWVTARPRRAENQP